MSKKPQKQKIQSLTWWIAMLRFYLEFGIAISEQVTMYGLEAVL